jgi:hypothetical protein
MIEHLLACGNEILINTITSLLSAQVKRTITKLPEKMDLKLVEVPHHDSHSGMPGILLGPMNNANHLTYPMHIHIFFGALRASAVLKDLKNGTAAVDLPKGVSSAMEHVCYLFLLIQEHVRYLSCTYVCTYTHYVDPGALGLSKDTHNVEPGRLVCCEQQSKIVATEL